jgi:oligopeptide transport system substrate-binding protein
MIPKPTRIFHLLLLTLALAITIGCKSKTPLEQANLNKILILGNGTEPVDIDPHIVTGLTEHNILIGLLEGLVIPNPRTLKPEPGTAERWEISEDGKTYTFHLREDAKWSNGQPVLAEHFAFSYQRILSPALASEYAYMLYPIKNGEKYHRGEIDDFSLVGIKVLDDRTLQIEIDHPVPYFLSLITHFTWSPVYPPSVLKYGRIDERRTHWTRKPEYATNGPFQLKSWKIWDELEIEKNPYYWDADNVKLNGIRFLPIDNQNTEERSFRADQLHVTNTIPSHKIEKYKKDNDPALRIDPDLGVYYYLLNTTIPPLNDVRVRKALAMSVDRVSIVETIIKGGQEPAYNYTPPGAGGYEAKSRMTYDIEEAKQLLSEAGFPGGKNFPSLEILFNTSESHKAIAEAIQDMWKENLGINISLINQDWKVYLKTRKEKKYQIARASWIGDYNDPNTFLDMWTSESGINHSGWGSPEYDQLIRDAGMEKDPEKRFEIFQNAERILIEQAVCIPIYFYKSVYLKKESVQNWHPNILNWHPYKHLDLKSEN